MTISCGTNVLVGRDLDRFTVEIRRIWDGKAKTGNKPELWDGKAGERIAESLVCRYQPALELSATRD